MKEQLQPTANRLEKKTKNISFKIERINDVAFTHTSLEKRGIKYNHKKIENFLGWTSTIDKKLKEFRLTLTINFIYKVNEKSAIPIISYSNENVFLISNFDKIITKDKFSIDKNFVLNFLSISISTARGILISKLGNTEYSKIILQPVNSETLETIYLSGRI